MKSLRRLAVPLMVGLGAIIGSPSISIDRTIQPQTAQAQIVEYQGKVNEKAIENKGDNPLAPFKDFCACYNHAYNNALLNELLKDQIEIVHQFEPGIADSNGSGYIDKRPEEDIVDIGGNGMLDCSVELEVLRRVLTGEVYVDNFNNGLSRDLVIRMWDKNEEQFAKDVGNGYWGLMKNLIPALPPIVKGTMILGDGSADNSIQDYVSYSGSAGFIKALMFLLGDKVTNSNINLSDYGRLPQYFSAEGDADGDKVSNRQEFEAYGNNLETYIQNALNPDVYPTYPEGEGENITEGEIEREGEIEYTEGEVVREGENFEGEVVREGENIIEGEYSEGEKSEGEDEAGFVREAYFDTIKLSIEEGGMRNINVCLSKPSKLELTLYCKSVDGSAINGIDYSAQDIEFNFEPGESKKDFYVLTNDNYCLDGNRDFSYVLSSKSQNIIIDNPNLEVTIKDDDFSLIPVLTNFFYGCTGCCEK